MSAPAPQQAADATRREAEAEAAELLESARAEVEQREPDAADAPRTRSPRRPHDAATR